MFSYVFRIVAPFMGRFNVLHCLSIYFATVGVFVEKYVCILTVKCYVYFFVAKFVLKLDSFVSVCFCVLAPNGVKL